MHSVFVNDSHDNDNRDHGLEVKNAEGVASECENKVAMKSEEFVDVDVIVN